MKRRMASPWWVLGAVTFVAVTTVGVTTLFPVSVRAQTTTPVSGPNVSRLQISFTFPVSTYTVTASDPAGGPLTYEWRMVGENCGTPRVPWTRSGAQVTWSHSDQPPDNCGHKGPDHEVTVSVVVTGRSGSTQCLLHGSEPVDIQNPPCTVGATTPTATPDTRTPAPTPTARATGPAVGGPGTFDRDIPDVGVNTAVWNGGTVDQLAAACAAAGGISVTVYVDGKPLVLIPGAPAFVNAAFNAAFPDGSVPSGTIVLVVR